MARKKSAFRVRAKLGVLVPLSRLEAGDYLIELHEWSTVLLYRMNRTKYSAKFQRQIKPKQGRKWLVLDRFDGYTRVIASFEGLETPLEGWLEDRTTVADYWKAVRL